MDSNDEELVSLIARCAIRDQPALKQLFDRQGAYLHAVALRIVQSDSLCQEVLQDAFVQMWQNAGSYRPDIARPRTWMTSIVRYRALDLLARERKHGERRRVHDNDDILEHLAGGSDPEGEVQQWQVRGLLAECFATLNRNMRDSIVLAYLEGYSREELARRFATNINTVKSWLHRGADRLRRCLESRINP